MSTGHFEDIDNDRPDGIAEVMRETAFSFEAPASAVMYAGALAQARRHRRRSAAAGVLTAVAVVGVAGAVVTQNSTRAGVSPASSATTPAGGSSSPAKPTTEPTTKPATAADRKALADFVLNTGIGALPAGSHIEGDPSSGVEGSKFPPQKRLPVTPPTDVLGGVNGAWAVGPGGATSVSIEVQVRTLALTCDHFKTLSPQDVCTTTPFAKGGEVVSHQYRKDSIHQTGQYFRDYIWLRPDGADVIVSQVAPSESQFVWTGDQVDGLLARPAWDQAVTQLKAFIADAGRAVTGG
ncbi:hypothetical protein ABH926_005500 [Catenulispora sp. GP43]|uniref:hypothetical protein n=1 Tax=Catenulispora sp. GP43 TaxID=3156263 RepID=UPI003517483A